MKSCTKLQDGSTFNIATKCRWHHQNHTVRVRRRTAEAKNGRSLAPCLLTDDVTVNGALISDAFSNIFSLCVGSLLHGHIIFVCGQQFCSRVYTQGASCCASISSPFIAKSRFDSTSAWRLKSGLQKIVRGYRRIFGVRFGCGESACR